MEQRVAGQQAGVIARLAETGVKETQSSFLSNSVMARLTTEQIREIARRPDVKRIIWNREDFVSV